MRYALALTAFAASLAAQAAAAAPPPATPPAVAKPKGPSDKARIEALERGFIAAFNTKDANKVMSYYARQGLFVFDVGPPREHVGWESYRKDWQDLFAAFPGPMKAGMSDLDVTVVGPVAYGHNIQTASFTAANGAKLDMAVRVTDVYRKIDGRWKIVQEHVSVPVDLATMKPDLESKP